jgi:hypothetical protein
MLDKTITKRILEGSLRGIRPAGKLRNRWEDEALKEAPKCSIPNIGAQRKDTGVIGGKNQGRP